MIEDLFVITALMPVLLVMAVAANASNIKKAIYTGKAILSAGILCAISALIFLLSDSQFQTPTLGFENVGISLRIDSLSTAMFLMVSIIGFIVLRFSQNYLDGDSKQLIFIRRLLSTIALVQLLVISGSLLVLFITWVATSISLQYLINYYKERKETQQAVKKKFVIARMSDLALFTGLLFLYFEFGSIDLSVIFQGLKNIQTDHVSLNLELSGLFLALAAIIKSVQVPFHGWVLDVMEAPTPVSALLHAGLLNAGPFLIIRFAFLMDLTTIGPLILLVAGGISALYGAIVFPSQPAVKTSLAYSSIGHMGFSLMICGMGLYSAALLHLIAHSFYKAHSFLSSGSSVDKYRLNQLKGDVRFNITIGNFISGFLITCILYLVIAELSGGAGNDNFQLLVLGAIIITGVSSYMIKTASLENGLITIFKSVFISGFVLLAFFTFENSIKLLIIKEIPAINTPNTLIKGVSLTLLALYVMTVFLPIILKKNLNETGYKWQTFRRHGFYIHIVFDRFLNALYPKMTR